MNPKPEQRAKQNTSAQRAICLVCVRHFSPTLFDTALGLTPVQQYLRQRNSWC